MSHIPYQIARQKRPTDNGLLERIERDGDNHSLYAVLALISRTADILESSDYLNERLEDEAWVAFDALDKLSGRLSTILYEDEAGITADNRRCNEINDYNDMRRAEAVGK